METEDQVKQKTVEAFGVIMRNAILLEEEQLSRLNGVIIRTVNDIRNKRNRAEAMKYRAGDSVTWTDRDGIVQESTVIRVNDKTCTVRNKADDREWRVSFGFLTKKEAA